VHILQDQTKFFIKIIVTLCILESVKAKQLFYISQVGILSEEI
jgi:hypothetical protein